FALGIITWSLILNIVNESCNVFISAEYLIKQINLPFSVHVYRLVYRNILIFLHHLLVYIFIAVYFSIHSLGHIYMIVPAMVLYTISSVGLGFILGLFCTRYRD